MGRAEEQLWPIKEDVFCHRSQSLRLHTAAASREIPAGANLEQDLGLV